jgi:transcriptional regulator
VRKQRPLTQIQLTVLTLKLDGATNQSIAEILGIHPATVSCKYSDIKRGIAKGAYNNLPENLSYQQSLPLFKNDI